MSPLKWNNLLRMERPLFSYYSKSPQDFTYHYAFLFVHKYKSKPFSVAFWGIFRVDSKMGKNSLRIRDLSGDVYLWGAALKLQESTNRRYLRLPCPSLLSNAGNLLLPLGSDGRSRRFNGVSPQKSFQTLFSWTAVSVSISVFSGAGWLIPFWACLRLLSSQKHSLPSGSLSPGIAALTGFQNNFCCCWPKFTCSGFGVWCFFSLDEAVENTFW